MKAAQFNTYGDSSVIEINENATNPQPAAGQILVEVHAAGVNPVDAAIRSGFMQQMMPLPFPVTSGGDFSGVVTQVGEGVTDFKVGDEVFGQASPFKGGTGTFAEFVAANAGNTAIKPKNLDHIKTAALPLVGTSVIQALEEHISLKEGQKILIHGGAGGIGSLAVQLAKALGAYVTTTVSTHDVEFVKGLGVDEVIDYKTQDFTSIIKDYDAVFDTVGGETTNKSISVLKAGGVLVSMAGQPDQELATQHNITALTQMTQSNTQQLNRLKEIFEADTIKPVMDKTFTLEQTKEAFDTLAEHPRGKVVIEIKK